MLRFCLPPLMVALLGSAPAVAQTSAFSWTGFYVGANAGYGAPDIEGVFDIDDIVVLPGSVMSLDDLEADGILGGPHVGANYQYGYFVVGIEADASFAKLEGDTFEPASGDEQATLDVDFLASLRLRGGFALDRFLVYGTGGGAYVNAKYTAVDDLNADEGGPFSGSQNLDQFGYVAGGGLEWAGWDNISVRAEGLFYVFGDEEDTSDILGDPGPFESDVGDFAKLRHGFVARAGVSYRF